MIVLHFESAFIKCQVKMLQHLILDKPNHPDGFNNIYINP